jgi:hypothetical protein
VPRRGATLDRQRVARRRLREDPPELEQETSGLPCGVVRNRTQHTGEDDEPQVHGPQATAQIC